MTNEDKIIQFLKKAERGYDDDELSDILKIRPRQQINQICRRLEKQGVIIRRRVGGKIRNFLNTEEQRQKLQIDTEEGLGEYYETEEIAEGEIRMAVSYERDLEEYTVTHLNQLENGLTLYPNGQQFTTEAGRIDILALDKDDNLVVIELKAGIADSGAIGQILAYMNCIRRDPVAEGKKVRGMIVANDFDEKLKYATSDLPNIKLKKYEVKFEFRDLL